MLSGLARGGTVGLQHALANIKRAEHDIHLTRKLLNGPSFTVSMNSRRCGIP